MITMWEVIDSSERSETVRCGAASRYWAVVAKVVTGAHGTSYGFRHARTWDLETGGARRASRFRAVALKLSPVHTGLHMAYDALALGNSRVGDGYPLGTVAVVPLVQGAVPSSEQ